MLVPYSYIAALLHLHCYNVFAVAIAKASYSYCYSLSKAFATSLVLMDVAIMLLAKPHYYIPIVAMLML
jgi:hypothetical protein